MKELETIIKLMEGVYPRQERNTPEKMQTLIQKDYKVMYSQRDIMRACGMIVEDWEQISNKIENL